MAGVLSDLERRKSPQSASLCQRRHAGTRKGELTELKTKLIQNHRMFRVGRDLCGSSGPTPLPKQGHPEQAAQDLVQAGLEYLQRRRLHNMYWLAFALHFQT